MPAKEETPQQAELTVRGAVQTRDAALLTCHSCWGKPSGDIAAFKSFILF